MPAHKNLASLALLTSALALTACPDDIAATTDTPPLTTGQQSSSGLTSVADEPTAGVVATQSTGSTSSSSTDSTSTAGAEATTSGSTSTTCSHEEPEQTCDGMTKSASCFPHGQSFCGSLKFWCQEPAFEYPGDAVGLCEDFWSQCETGNDPCNVCQVMELTCLAHNPKEMCADITEECMCIGAAHGLDF